MANKLANLSRYHARCKLIEGDQLAEHTIKTFEEPQTSEGGEERALRIRARSRQKYGRSRKQVEMEIAQRLATKRPSEEGPVYEEPPDEGPVY